MRFERVNIHLYVDVGMSRREIGQFYCFKVCCNRKIVIFSKKLSAIEYRQTRKKNIIFLKEVKKIILLDSAINKVANLA